MVSYLKTPFFHEPLFYHVLSKDIFFDSQLTGRSSLAPQHHQVLLQLWFKMRTLWMVLWEEESVGTVQLRDVYQGVV